MYLIQIQSYSFFQKQNLVGSYLSRKKTVQLAKNPGKTFRSIRKGLTRTKDCNNTEDEA